MIEFTALILKFNEKGEKTGWTYVEVPGHIAQELKPGNRKTFRVKGMLDGFKIEGIALLPMGDGNFIMPFNAKMRKGTRKSEGATLHVKLETHDDFIIAIPGYLTDCLDDEPQALEFFNSLPKSHRDYFVKWIESAKTEPTKTKRIAQTVSALAQKLNYGQMMRSLKKSSISKY